MFSGANEVAEATGAAGADGSGSAATSGRGGGRGRPWAALGLAAVGGEAAAVRSGQPHPPQPELPLDASLVLARTAPHGSCCALAATHQAPPRARVASIQT